MSGPPDARSRPAGNGTAPKMAGSAEVKGTARTRAIQVAVLSCRLRGCNCSPDASLTSRDGVTHVEIAHDGWCRVLGGDG